MTKITIFIGEILRNNDEIRGFTKDSLKNIANIEDLVRNLIQIKHLWVLNPNNRNRNTQCMSKRLYSDPDLWGGKDFRIKSKMTKKFNKTVWIYQYIWGKSTKYHRNPRIYHGFHPKYWKYWRYWTMKFRIQIWISRAEWYGINMKQIQTMYMLANLNNLHKTKWQIGTERRGE